MGKFMMKNTIAGAGRVPGRLAPVNVLDNAKQAHTQGLDIQLALDPVESLTLTANLGLLDTELDEFVAQRDPAQRLPYDPPIRLISLQQSCVPPQGRRESRRPRLFFHANGSDFQISKATSPAF